MIRRPPRSTLDRSSAASDVYKRQEFHGRVARWLEDHAGERVGEYLGLIAEHYVQAGEYDRAADYYQRSGEQAIRTNVFRAARAAFERALSLRELSGAPPEASLPHYLMPVSSTHLTLPTSALV